MSKKEPEMDICSYLLCKALAVLKPMLEIWERATASVPHLDSLSAWLIP